MKEGEDRSNLVKRGETSFHGMIDITVIGNDAPHKRNGILGGPYVTIFRDVQRISDKNVISGSSYILDASGLSPGETG